MTGCRDQQPISRSNMNYDVAKYLYEEVKSQLEQRYRPRLAGKLVINQKFSQKFTEQRDRERKSLLAPGVGVALPLIE